MKDEDGNTHRAVLVDVKGTSEGVSKRPGLSTIVEEGESSEGLKQQSSSSQTGSGAGAQGSSGSSPSGNKGALSSGQQGQGSLSQQSASGSGAQGGSGDGSGGKKTPSSPVSGQATSSSAQQIEVKDEEGKTHQAVLVNTKGTSGGGVQGSSGSSPSGSRGASLEQQSSSSQTGSGAGAQGSSGSSPSGNKGASSSGQQGQGSSSQQSASGSGSQGGSGDGSGGKRTPSSPVSGQTTSSSAQIEVKDEQGNTHQVVLVNTKGTSGGGTSKKPGLSTIVEEGESSKAIGEQGKKSSSTQTGGAQKGSGAGAQGSSEVNKGGSKTSSTLVKQQKQWDGSGKVDFDEVKKSLKPVSGTTTGKETQGSEGIDLNETRKNLRPVSGTTTGKETQGSEGIDLNEAKKNLRPVSGTTTGKETQGSEGIDLNEAKKNLRPVSGSGAGTQGTDGDNTAGKKTSPSLVSSRGEVELKDDDGKIYKAVLVDVSEDEVEVSPKPGLSTIVEEGESSEGLKQQSSLTQIGSGDGHETTRMVPGVSTAKLVRSVVKIEQASSEAVAGNKSFASLLGKQTQQGSSSETVVEQKQSSLKKGSTTTTTDKSSGSSGGIDFDQVKSLLKKVEQTKTEEKSSSSSSKDFDEAKKKLKPVTQSEKSGGESSGAVTQTELQLAIANLRKSPPIGTGMYEDEDGNEDVSKYILVGRGSYGGTRNQIDFQRNVKTDEKLTDFQGEKGFVKAAAQVWQKISEEDKKIKVSNQTGSINIYTETDESGDLKINTSTISKNLEDGIGPLNVDPKFAKTLARNIEEGYQKKLQEMESKGLSQ
ncbi:hypothetical protein A6P36_05200 [Candidatus Arthromitus sp. SFB-turkey]|nr:hypothetical protein A6P36_05200 [Candidatus Arthromitus sp. SFB-turkey]